MNNITNKYTDKYTKKYTNEYTDKRTNEYTDKCTDKYTNECTDKCTDKYRDKYTNEYTDKCTNKYTNECTNKCMDKYTSNYTNKYTSNNTPKKNPNIKISHLTKRYKNNVTALEDISFTVGSGVYGLLGHNGAGKTTLMKALVTVLEPSDGKISVCGFDTKTQGEQVRSLIGYLPQELTMYESLTVFDFVNYMAQLKGVRSREAVMEVLKQVDMHRFSGYKIGRLSGGMKRRVGIAQALVGNPRVLVVDEPTAGLDPEERVRFRGVLSHFAQNGRTVLLSTHIVEDVHQICEELAVLRGGHLFYAGTAASLMALVEGKVRILHLDREEELFGLQNRAVVLATSYEKHGLTARIMDENMVFSEAGSVAATLEDAYVYCMGGILHE